MPKVELYFTGERFLKEQKVIISDENYSDKLIYLELKDGDIYFEGIKFLNFENIKVAPLLLFNSITLRNAKVNEDFIRFFPKNIEKISIYQSIINPIKIYLSGSGDFGVASGEIDLIEKKIYIEIEPSTLLNQKRALISKLKKVEDKLIYESSY